jgi:hypothetical protein
MLSDPIVRCTTTSRIDGQDIEGKLGSVKGKYCPATNVPISPIREHQLGNYNVIWPKL